jgi:protease IV
MRRAVLLATLLAPLVAAGQTATYVSRALGYPAGLALPSAGVASGEEPAALAVNPAAAGFNRGLTLQYFHERAEDRLLPAGAGGMLGDGIYAAAGPLALTSEWIRPASGPHYRKLGLGLGIGGRTASVGLSWNGWSSDDPGLARLRTWDLGITVRPIRWLSLGAAALDLDGRLAGTWLPVRYQFGVATRLLGDSLTISTDWFADDRARGTFQSRAVALGVGLESPFGIAIHAQVHSPTQRHVAGIPGAAIFQLALSFQTRRAGLVAAAGGTGRDHEASSLLGLRVSSRDYRGLPLPPRPLLVDLVQELDPPRTLLRPSRSDPFGALLRKLDALAQDDEVGTVVVRIDRLALAPGHADELRAALLALRARKPVIAWIHGGGLREYALATAASRIEMLPAAMLYLTGHSSTSLYLKDTLARLGIAFEAVAIGKYKNAPDPLVRGDISDAEREVKEAVLGDLYGREVAAVAEARRLPEARVRALVDQGLFSAAEARQAGLVDGLAWPDELEKRLRASGGLARGWSEPEPRLAQRWGPRPAVAVIRVSGTIVPGRSRGGVLPGGLSGADTVVSLIRKASQDGDVKAIVLRVDSPGGDAVASDLIWRALTEARRRGKPVVVSMGDVAASGGYWISTAGDAIVAEPSTLTGSIGVFALKPDLSGLLAKLDARQVTVKRGARADLESPFRPWTEEEREAIRRELGAVYSTFLGRVSHARKLTPEEVDRAAQGRVWTGAQALERKLVDRLGSLQDAVTLARDRARIAPGEAVEVRRLEASRTLLEEYGPGADPGAGVLARLLDGAPELRAAAALLEMGPVVALPLGWVTPVAGGPAGEGP